MFCRKCGKQNNDDARFCMSCGAPLTNDAGEQQGAQAQAQQPTQAYPPSYNMNMPAQQPTQAYPPSYNMPVQQRTVDTAKRNKMIAIIAGSVVLITGIVLAIVFGANSGGSGSGGNYGYGNGGNGGYGNGGNGGYNTACGYCGGSGLCYSCNGGGRCVWCFGKGYGTVPTYGGDGDGRYDCPNCVNGVCGTCGGNGRCPYC